MSNQIINVESVVWSNKLSRDSLGRVFFWRGRCFRAILKGKEYRILRMFRNGLIEELVQNECILPTEISGFSLSDEKYGIILETKCVKNIIEPTEWCFDMFIAAIKHMIKMEKVLLKYNYRFYDFHPYNLLFDEGMKVYHIDIGSLVSAINGEDEQEFIKNIEKKYCRILYIWLITQKRPATFFLWDNIVSDYEWEVFVKGTGYNINISPINSLEDIMGAINFIEEKYEEKKKNDGIWSDYQDSFFDNQGRVKEYERFKIIGEYLKKCNIKQITELAGNQGGFSQYCLERKLIDYSLVLDGDERAVDKMYNRIKDKNMNINMGIVDLVSPFARDHYYCAGRMKNNACVALALLHHLCITQGVSLESAIEWIGEFGTEWLITEFMPLGMWDGSGGLNIPFWWTLENFRRIFEKEYIIIDERKIETNRVLFVGKKK